MNLQAVANPDTTLEVPPRRWTQLPALIQPPQSGTAVPPASLFIDGSGSVQSTQALYRSTHRAWVLGNDIVLHDITDSHTLSGLAYPSVTEPVTADDVVAADLKRIRELTALTINDIARLCGVKRRQLYNLLDGQATEPRRSRHIRMLRQAIERWARRFPQPVTLRSALFAPLDQDRRDFITIASGDAQKSLAAAIEAFEAYLKRLGDGRPVRRASSPARGAAAEAAQYLRELYGEDSSLEKA